MNVQEDETFGEPPARDRDRDRDRDVLAEPRARRGDPIGDPILIRRAEAAEAAAQALEERLAGIQARLQEAEQECASASSRLADREQELTRASERLSDGERQLSAVSQRLADREQELRSVSTRLMEREQELAGISARLGERERDLQHVELDIKGRLEALERRVVEVQGELLRERAARQSAEQELTRLRAAQLAIQPLVNELKQIASRLRLAAESAGASQPRPAPPVQSMQAVQQESGSAEMAQALAAAVQRLRARVASVEELQQGRETSAPAEVPAPPAPAEASAPSEESAATALSEPAASPPATSPSAAPTPSEAPPPGAAPESIGTQFIPQPVVARPQPERPWLTTAIRRVAQRRDARLAAELVSELLPAQALNFDGAVRYLARIAELGNVEVALSGGRGSARLLMGLQPSGSPDFVVEGPVAAFARLAGGGAAISVWRPPAGLRIRSGRRRARRLMASRRAPTALAELAAAEITLWPGLLLLAFAEAIEPARTTGQEFAIHFAIEGAQHAMLRVCAAGGSQLAVTRLQDADADAGSDAPEPAAGAGERTADAGEQTADAEERTADAGEAQVSVPDATVRLSERAFTRLFAGIDLGDEQVLLHGDSAPLQTLLAWTDEVQGIRRQPA